MGVEELLSSKREEILRIAARYGARNVRVFGSAVRGEARPDSDIDILVEWEPGRSLLDHFEMPAGWQVVSVGDVATINELSIQANYPHRAIEYIDIASVEKGAVKSVQVLPLEDAPSRAKRIVRDSDTLIATVRPNLEHYVHIKRAKPNTLPYHRETCWKLSCTAYYRYGHASLPTFSNQLRSLLSGTRCCPSSCPRRYGLM